jgi:hypothetical protein
MSNAVTCCFHFFRRFYPNSLSNTLIYSELCESFGVTSKTTLPPNAEKQRKLSSSLNIMDLPIELHLKIFQSLDSFSLGNLSLTCIALRNTCCDLLDSRGCVALQWERLKIENKYHWQVAHKVGYVFTVQCLNLLH